MNRFDYKFLKYKIEFEVCPEHNENPKFIESANGYSIIACCENFKTTMIEKSTILVNEQTLKNLDEILKKALK